MTHDDDNSSTNKIWLRIIQVNDVYELENFPPFKTLVDENKHGPDKTLVILAGDFLGPSLLSSLDKGRGMVDTMNACGITQVCFGNHETDVPMPELAQRVMADSKFVWLNTNMRELDEKLDIETEAHQVIHVTHGDHAKNIGLLGLLTEDPSVYRPGSFAGAKIEPVLATAEAYMKVLEPLGLDLVIPLTHQRMNIDRDFCNKFGKTFPIVIGGHDHEPYDETIQGSRVVKTGMNADNTAIIDITWKIDDNGASCSEPEIKVDMVPTKTYTPDPEIEKRVRGHERILHELEQAKIFRINQWLPENNKEEPFSTQDNRLGPSNGSQVFCTLLRMGMRAHCCIMNSGNIRAGKVYPKDQEWFTWSDLKAELPFPAKICAVEIPGRVLEGVISYSRRMARQDPPVASGSYM
jgi:5'-nucleotidase